MNKTLITVTGALILGVTLPALAGPDWPTIERARKQKQTQAAQPKLASMGASAAPLATKCPPRRPVLLVDHGPRATGTPAQNRARLQRYEEQLKACQRAAG